MWVGEPPTVSQGFRDPGQEGQRGFHSDALNHSQLLRFLKGPPWCGPKRRPRCGNLCRGGVAGRGPSPGVLRNALQRDARGMQRQHGTGTKPRSSGARFLTTGKPARRGAAGVPRGAAGCPRGVLPSAAWLFWDPGEGQVPDVPHREILFQTTRLASHSPSNVIPHQAEATETRDTPRRPVLFPPCGRVLSQEGGCGSVPPRHICTERLLRRAIPPSGGGSLNGPQEPEAEECAGCQAHCEAG